MSRLRLLAAILTVAMTSGVAVDLAAADDFWVTVARGLQFAGWRPGTGDIGVSQHVFGDGWTVQTTRLLDDFEAFGGVVGFDFSNATSPTGAVLPTTLDTELSYRTWLIPTVRLRLATELNNTDTPAPVDYSFWVNTGVQDVEISGTGSIEAQLDINALGFYDLEAFISNRGEFNIDGFLYADDGTLDFDLGPISLSGNIYIDILAAVTEPLFAALGVSNPLAVFTGRAKLKDQLAERDKLIARLEAGEVLSDAEMKEIINTSIMETIFGGGGSDVLELARESLAPDAGLGGDGILASSYGIPEPVSFGLWLAAAGAATTGRRRRP